MRIKRTRGAGAGSAGQKSNIISSHILFMSIFRDYSLGSKQSNDLIIHRNRNVFRDLLDCDKLSGPMENLMRTTASTGEYLRITEINTRDKLDEWSATAGMAGMAEESDYPIKNARLENYSDRFESR
jgi:hypothetical protein